MDANRSASTVSLPEKAINELLDRLDDAEGTDGAGGSATPDWVVFRVNRFPMVVQQPGGGINRMLVATRRVRSNGIQFLHRGFIHVDSKCTFFNHGSAAASRMSIVGRIFSCRHVVGDIHESMVLTDGAYDLRKVSDPTIAQTAEARNLEDSGIVGGEVLVLTGRTAEIKLLEHYLSKTPLNVTVTEDLEKAIQQTWATSFDVVVICLVTSHGHPSDIIRNLRDAGYSGPIILLDSSAASNDVRCDPNLESYPRIDTPVSASQMISVMESVLRPSQANVESATVVSQKRFDPSMADLLEWFRDEAAKLAQQLETAMMEHDSDRVREVCCVILDSAGGFGYAGLASAAGNAVTQLDATASIGESRTELRAVIAIAKALD